MFSITSHPLKPLPIEDGSPDAGALVAFEGRVRHLNKGKTVVSLEYEAYEELAVAEGEAIMKEALARFDLIGVEAAHWIGSLTVQDAAIRVAVLGVHRATAFDACVWIVDSIKSRVPIWKREHYEGGVSEWLCPGPVQLTEHSFYQRQMLLPQVGTGGQEKLKKARVLVVGAGGLGCAALPYLAGAGVGNIKICDGDRVDISNLHRQSLFTPNDTGKLKSSVAAERVRKQNPFIEVTAVLQHFDAHNADELTDWSDLILDCTDSMETKFLLNDWAVKSGTTLVHAAVYQFEGQIFCYVRGGPCLRCLWACRPPAGCVGTCAEVGVVGYVPGVLGAMQAGEAIKHLIGMSGQAASLTLLDLTGITTESIQIDSRPACICKGGPTCNPDYHPWQRIVADLVRATDFKIIDVRRSEEIASSPLAIKADYNPFETFDFNKVSVHQPTLLVCAHGVRSDALAKRCYESGLSNVFSLVGGVEGNPFLK